MTEIRILAPLRDYYRLLRRYGKLKPSVGCVTDTGIVLLIVRDNAEGEIVQRYIDRIERHAYPQQ